METLALVIAIIVLISVWGGVILSALFWIFNGVVMIASLIVTGVVTLCGIKRPKN